LDVTRLFVYAFIVAVSVLAVDMLGLFLLDLLKNADTVLLLIFLEAVAMMLVGTVGWGHREHEFPVVGWWKRTEIHHVRYRPRYPSFRLVIAMAGLMLMFIDVYLFSQYYRA